MANAPTSQKPANCPEAEFGPFPGGISIAVWVNEVQSGGWRVEGRGWRVEGRKLRVES